MSRGGLTSLGRMEGWSGLGDETRGVCVGGGVDFPMLHLQKRLLNATSVRVRCQLDQLKLGVFDFSDL